MERGAPGGGAPGGGAPGDGAPAAEPRQRSPGGGAPGGTSGGAPGGAGRCTYRLITPPLKHDFDTDFPAAEPPAAEPSAEPPARLTQQAGGAGTSVLQFLTQQAGAVAPHQPLTCSSYPRSPSLMRTTSQKNASLARKPMTPPATFQPGSRHELRDSAGPGRPGHRVTVSCTETSV